MSTLKKNLLIGLATLSLGAAMIPAQADEGRHGHAAATEKMQAKRAAHFTERMAKLHDKLKLTAAQEPAWTTFVAAITPQAGAHGEKVDWAALTAPERIEKRIARAKTHLAMMETHKTAVTTFYGQLSAEQKKVFDDNVIGGKHGPHRMMHMHKQHKSN